MTKRISQPTNVVVPVPQAPVADGAAVAAKAVVAPAEVEAAAVNADVVVEKAPVTVTVVAEPAMALVAPAPLAMVAADAAADAGEPAGSAAAAQDGGDDNGDMTAFIVGGALLAGGILAVALSSGDTDPIAVTPAPANTAPNFTSTTTATVAENALITTVVYDANAADTQGNAIVFTIGGTDAALFAIDASTGVVTLRNSANFEAKPTYSFTVTATDNGSPALSATQTITVTVTNVNEAPTFASATATATVAENIPTTTVVFTASATDPDVAGLATPLPNPLPAGSAITYSLGGPDAAAFAINATNGQVTFRASPDFETKSTYTFTVIATDNGATPLASTPQTVTLTVTNVNEAPAFTSPATAIIAENVAAGSVVYTSVTTDPEGTARTYSLGGADAGAFTINATTGVVSINASPDFETKASYNFTVTASDGVNATPRAVTLSVIDVAEGGATTTTSLDTATAAVSGLSATGAAQATVFTDNTATASNATINNFGPDDIVRFTGTTAVTFARVDDDLTIQFTNTVGGTSVSNAIRINDIVSPTAVITSEASAEAAVNAFFGTTGVDYFRFA